MRIVKIKKYDDKINVNLLPKMLFTPGHPSLTDTFHGRQEVNRCWTRGEFEVQVTKYTTGLPDYFVVLNISIKIIQNVG